MTALKEKAAKAAKAKKARSLEMTVPTKREVGRPTLYREEYIERVEKLCRLGATGPEIADFFGVSVDTITEWQNRHPEFSAAIKRGKVEADMDVAHSLYKRAIGYQSRVKRGDVESIIEIEPDTTAQIFWLKNRRPKDWRDRHEHTGAEGGPLQVTWLTEALPDDPTK